MHALETNWPDAASFKPPSDTTVQALTSSPTVRDGVLIYEDSPLVRAAKEGPFIDIGW